MTRTARERTLSRSDVSAMWFFIVAGVALVGVSAYFGIARIVEAAGGRVQVPAVFEGTIRPEGAGYVAEGPLRLRDQQMPVTLPFDLTITDGVAVMQGQAVMDRRDWQVGAGYADESTVGFQVDLTVALTATR